MLEETQSYQSPWPSGFDDRSAKKGQCFNARERSQAFRNVSSHLCTSRLSVHVAGAFRLMKITFEEVKYIYFDGLLVGAFWLNVRRGAELSLVQNLLAHWGAWTVYCFLLVISSCLYHGSMQGWWDSEEVETNCMN